LKVTQSRNKREGKYISRWCYNPGIKGFNKKTNQYTYNIRAGAHFDLVKVKHAQLGIVLLRKVRKEFE
jgi:ribosomal protein S16